MLFRSGRFWGPHYLDNPSYGAFPLIIGTLLSTFLAMVFAVPIGVAAAVYISEIASPKMKAKLKATIEILAGIPSVVYGFFGLQILCNWLRVSFDKPQGQSWLAASIILAIMSLPTIISVSEDALTAVPVEYREASLAIGGNKLNTISRVVIPSASSGITTAIILGMGRAIGETMAVIMVAGNAGLIPEPITNVFSPIRTITATLGIETAEVPFGSPHFHALFALVIILFVIIIFINTLAEIILTRLNQKFRPTSHVETKFPRISNQFILRVRKFGKVNKSRFANGNFLCFVFWALSISMGWYISLLIVGLFVALVKAYQALPNNIQEKIIFSLIACAILLVLFVLAIILYSIISKGIGVIGFVFILGSPRDLGRAGGIFPTIVGTLYLVGGAVLFSVPLGIAAGIYLSEYAKESKFTRILRTGIDNLNGTPSIVFGLFGFVVFVLLFGWGRSLLAGQVTLALMILPTIIRTTEESFRSVPQALREGSLALGCSKWYTIRKVVLPSAAPGIITGTILGMGRAAGETAPIMFTAVVFYRRALPNSFMEPVMALPYHLFLLTTTVPNAKEYAFGTALVLLVLVLILYGIAMKFRSKMKHKAQSQFFY